MNSEILLSEIDTSEQQAMTLGDLKTAIRLNWLYNAIKFDGMEYDEACYRWQEITIGGK
jgi:hypothetical protein